MSRLPAFLSALKRKYDSAPQPEAVPDSQNDGPQDNVFNLVPPKADDGAAPQPEATEPEKPALPEKGTRDVRSIGITDLSRLSIDNDGRLYWDGKPVEVRRRIMMSRAQVVGTSVVAAFLVIGAIGAAIQGTSAMRDWACRLGWTNSYCGMPGTPSVRPYDIPA